ARAEALRVLEEELPSPLGFGVPLDEHALALIFGEQKEAPERELSDRMSDGRGDAMLAHGHVTLDAAHAHAITNGASLRVHRLLRHDVDDAGECIRAIERRAGSANELHALDVLEWQIDVDARVQARIQSLPVDEDEDRTARDASNAREVASFVGQVERV